MQAQHAWIGSYPIKPGPEPVLCAGVCAQHPRVVFNAVQSGAEQCQRELRSRYL